MLKGWGQNEITGNKSKGKGLRDEKYLRTVEGRIDPTSSES
jgi:hypothetical protein